MRLWILERETVDCDEVRAMVIRAESPEQARRIAQDQAACEGAGAWATASLARVMEEGEAKLICRDFCAG